MKNLLLKLLTIIFALTLCLGIFTACGDTSETPNPPAHTHDYKTLKYNETSHWDECECGDKINVENHKGGTATCQVKATCSICDTVYGDFAEHEPKTAWVITDTHHYHECVYGCNEKLNYSEHRFTDYVSNKDATYESDGSKTAQCDGGCGKTHTITDAGSMLIKDEIRFTTLTVDGKNVYGKVSNATTEFVFYEEIFVSGNATYVVDDDKSCSSPILSKTVDLVVGDNTFYVLETVGNNVKLYTVTIHRREMFTVTFNTDGGSYVAPQTIEEDSLATKPNNPTKTGYDFVSWDYSFNTAITKETVINAKWDINQYTLTIVYNNGQNDLVITQDYNSYIETISNPTKTGYSFAGWDKTIPSKMPAEDVTINATWKINQYTITIVYNNGQANLVIKQDYNTDVETIANPEKTGYTFAGWDITIPSKMPAEDVIITASWKESTKTPYRVEYYLENLENDNYSILSSATENLTGTTNSTVYANIKTFEHFTAEKTSVSGVVAANGTTVLKVYYQRDEYTVTFDGNGGTLINGKEVQTVKYGGSVIAPTYIKEGYTFKPFEKENLANINNSFTAFATWDINQYKLTLIFDNGEKNETITKDFNSYINVVNPQRVGYTFDGWDKAMPIRMPAEDVSIKAKWLAIFSLSNNEIVGLTDHGKTLKEIIIPNEIDSAKIMSVGRQAFKDCENFTSVVIAEGVTAIGENAFYNCTELINIEIPNSVTSIGGDAFYYCTSLTSVTIGNSVTSIGNNAFYNCDSLTSVTIGNSVTSIGNNAFYNCDSLTSIIVDDNNANYKSIDGNLYSKDGKTLIQYAIGKTATSFDIPNSVTSIGGSAFSSCWSLESVVIPNSVTSIGNYAFSWCESLESIVIPNSVTSIGNHAFSSCWSLESVVIPNSVTSIGDEAFSSCWSLESVVIPNSVTSIGSGAFYWCESLESIVIPNSVTSIGSGAFVDCDLLEYYKKDGLKYLGNSENNYLYLAGVENKSITTATIDSSCKFIGDAFYYCTSLTSIIVDDNNANYKSIDGNLYSKDGKTLIKYAIGKTDTAFTIPNSVTSIGNYAFRYCTSLESIVIPNSVKSIGYQAFYGCTSLESIEIPNSVTSIGDWAFYDCDSLTSIVIPNSVTSIGDGAFSYCHSLESIVIPNSVTSIGYGAFSGCNSLTIYCKAESKPGGWSEDWNSSNRPVVWGYKEN